MENNQSIVGKSVIELKAMAHDEIVTRESDAQRHQQNLTNIYAEMQVAEKRESSETKKGKK